MTNSLNSQARSELESIRDSLMNSCDGPQASIQIRAMRSVVNSLEVNDSDNGWDDVASQYGRLVIEVCNSAPAIVRCTMFGIALNGSWPEYVNGEGYWDVPSMLADLIVMDALTISDNEFALLELHQETIGAGMPFIDLGIAGSTRVNSDSIVRAATRSSSMPDFPPILITASANPKLDSSYVHQFLGQSYKSGNGQWLRSFITRSDGWTWPDWQSAFQVVSEAAKRSRAFWAEVLTPSIDGICPIAQWDEEEEFEPELYEGYLDDLKFYLSSDPKLEKIALASGWVPAQELVERLER